MRISLELNKLNVDKCLDVARSKLQIENIIKNPTQI